ncbi:unnamed protein product [Ilex paraguariensis]|uniref:Uncharacterized protein n=1 Tax=Ilex paraguariensis TaxID=185542 RepID=A0ABC8T8G0_9AQUA
MASSEDTFPVVDADRELNHDWNKNFEVDPVSSEMATSLEIKIWNKNFQNSEWDHFHRE